MNITKIIFITLACLLIIVLLRRINSDYATFTSCALSVSITFFSLMIMLPVFDYIKELSSKQAIGTLGEIMFKSAGISLLCSLAGEICSDAGEPSLSSKIELAGKCTLLTYCLPLIKKVFEYATTFIA